jgi:hemoglobin
MSGENLYQRLGGENAVNALVESFYEKMLDDYRVRRFFNATEQDKQLDALKALVAAILVGHANDDDFKLLMRDFFMSAFARFKAKELIPESGLDFFAHIVGEDSHSSKFLCDSHSHLLTFIPNDTQYDIVMEHLTTSLEQLNVESSIAAEVLAVAESGRNSVLGK